MTNKARKSDLDRRDVIKRILSGNDEVLAIGGLGNAGYDLVAARGEHPLNFTIHGAGMGGAPTVGLGLALAQPRRRVVVVLGDGDMLMGTVSLATIAAQRPGNLAILVMDNERYQETGAQATATGMGVDLAGMAAAAGFRVALTLDDAARIDDAVDKVLRAPGPVFVNVKISDVPAQQLPKVRDGVLMKLRFRGRLGID
ncbi:MAG: aldehyde dehydrogenase [candidate division NC10 bacterium]|nr:aldehyde dehydrogenase [candidate division NC10 bacterium]